MGELYFKSLRSFHTALPKAWVQAVGLPGSLEALEQWVGGSWLGLSS